MSTRFQRLIVVANLLIAIFFAIGWVYIDCIVILGAPFKVTELDRKEVINETKLAEFYPDLALNTRYNLGRWIAEKAYNSASVTVKAGLLAAVLNVILLKMGFRAARKKCSGEGVQQIQIGKHGKNGKISKKYKGESNNT